MGNWTLVVRIAAAHRRSVSYLNRHVSRLGLRRNGDFAFLLVLQENSGLSQEEIAFALALDKSSVARVIGRLCVQGLVRREVDERDHRVFRVFLSEKGRALLPALRAQTAVWEQVMTQGLSAEEQETLTRLLARVTENAVRATAVKEEQQ